MINKTILKDLESATRDCATKQQELKQERLKLIKEKIREKLGGEAADRIVLSSGRQMWDRISGYSARMASSCSRAQLRQSPIFLNLFHTR